MVTLLEHLRKYTVIDLDSNDVALAEKFKPMHDMTSNQFIVKGDLAKPEYQSIVHEAVAAALKLAEEEGIKNKNTLVHMSVDFMTVMLGTRVLPHIDPKGYVHAQTLPSLAYYTEGTVKHAERLVKFYGLMGVPRERVCIKIPSTVEGLRACSVLKNRPEPINTLGTTCFTVAQAVAAADAGCIAVSPYVNPLWVHFPNSGKERVAYADPLSEMRGMIALRDIQVEFRRRKTTTKVKAASFVTAEEIMSSAGVDQVTLFGSILETLASTELTPELEALASKAVAAYTYDPSTETKTELIQYPVEEPATELRKALAEKEIAELMEDALTRFRDAELELLEIAREGIRATGMDPE